MFDLSSVLSLPALDMGVSGSDTIQWLDRLFHPFGDLRLWRWVAFGVFFLLWAAYPLLYRSHYRVLQEDGSGIVPGTRSIPKTRLGLLWLVIGLSGLAMLTVAICVPYGYAGLEWKVFAPFSQRGSNRLLTFLVIFPLIFGAAALTYIFNRKPIPAPSRLVLAGTRALGLLIVFFLICAPYTTQEKMAERPYRSVVLIDDSLSMGDSVREFAIFSPVKIADALSAQLVKDGSQGQQRLDQLKGLVREDDARAREAREEIRRLGLPEPEVMAIELADIEPSDFQMREFVRQQVLLRAKRLKAKIVLLQGAEIDFVEWLRRERTIEEARDELRRKQDELAAEAQQEKPDEGRLALVRNDIKLMQERLDLAVQDFHGVLESGALLGSVRAKSTGSKDPKLERANKAVHGLIRNLLSTVDARGPTRWDLACELFQPGNELTVQKLRGLGLIRLSVSPASGQLSLLDLLRRNPTVQPDRLPPDLAEMAQQAGIPIATGNQSDASLSRRPLTLYTFSAVDAARGRAGVLKETEVEELDFQRPEGKTTQVYAAYNAVLATEASGDVATIMLVSDGFDTSPGGGMEAKESRERARALADLKDAPALITVAVGHPRPEKILALDDIHGDLKAIKDELVHLDLRIRANTKWNVEVLLCEDNPENEVPYIGLNGQEGLTSITVSGGANGDEEITPVRLSFKAERGGAHQYWVKLNRRRLPGEDSYVNNVRTHDLEVVDRKIRVLYIEERFRYEARYLIEAACRDTALEFHSFVYAADDGWKQKRSEYSTKVKRDMPSLREAFCKIVEGGTPNARTTRARTREEWLSSKYDVVIIGDVNPTRFTSDERKWLSQFVTENRGGIIWLAGMNFNPYAYNDPDLRDIFPVKTERPSGSDYQPVNTGRMKYMGITPIGWSHELLRFSERLQRQWELWGRASDLSFTPGQLDGYYWYAKVKGPKNDTCSVIARVAEKDKKLRFFDSPTDRASDALIVTGDFGAGRAMFVGTDELWRMRRFFADFYTYRFWQNAIRWAATNRLRAKDSDIDLHTDEKRYLLGQQVNFYCELVGSSDLYAKVSARQQDEINRIRSSSDDPTIKDKPILLVNWRNATGVAAGSVGGKLDAGTLVLVQAPGRSNFFQGRYYPNAVGKYELSLANEPATTKTPTIFFVQASTEQMAELSQTQVNADLLTELASHEKIGSGESTVEGPPRFHRFYAAEQFNPELRSKTVVEGTREREAFSLVELMLVLAFIFAAEWLIRKMVRLA